MKKANWGKYTALCLLISGMVLTSCADPSIMDGYDTLEFTGSGGKSVLVSAINLSSNNICAALRDYNDLAVIAALEGAASRGVTVKVLIDYNNKASLNGISAQVSTNFGNSYGILDSSFFIIDDMIYLLSSYDLAANQFVLFKMSDRDMLISFQGEFDQMFRDKRFAWGSDLYEKKLPLNIVQNYYINDNWVEIYFMPIDNALPHIKARLGQTSVKIEAYLRSLDNSSLAEMLEDVLDSCPGSKIHFAPGALSKLTNYSFLLANGGDVLTSLYDFNFIFVDLGTPYQTAILTTADLLSEAALLQNDGTCLMITGPYVSNIYQTVKSVTSGASVSNVTITPYTLKSPVLFHDVVISEILWKGVYLNAAQTTIDYGPCFIELKNVSTQYIAIGGYRLIITNQNVQSEPNMFVIPGGTVLPPGGHYTIVSSTTVFSQYDYYWEWMFLRHDGFTMILQDSSGANIDRAADVNTPAKDYKGNTGIPMVRDLTLPIGDGSLIAEWNAAVTMKNYYPTYASYGNIGTPGSD